jgi:GAF domain-containing protein
VLKHADEIRLGSSGLKIQFLIEGTRASDHEESRVKQLLDALRELHASPETREVCARAATTIMGLTGACWAAVALCGASKNLEMVAAVDGTGHLPDGPSAIALHVASTARSYFHPSRLCVPVMGHDGLLGVIDAGPREARPYQAGEMNLLEALAAHVGVALANAQRNEIAAPMTRQEAAAR